MLPIGLLPRRLLAALPVRASFGETLSTSPHNIAYALVRGGVPLLLRCLLPPIRPLHQSTTAVVSNRPKPNLGVDYY